MYWRIRETLERVLWGQRKPSIDDYFTRYVKVRGQLKQEKFIGAEDSRLLVSIFISIYDTHCRAGL